MLDQQLNPLNGFIRSLQADGKSPATVSWSRKRLNQFARWLESREFCLDCITARHMDEYAASLCDRDLSEHTVYGHRKLLRQFFKWCVQRGHLDRDPTTYWRIKQTPPPDPEAERVRLEDILALLDACHLSTPPRDLRDEALVRLLFSTGMRAGEVIGLRLRDVRWRHGRCELRIRRAKGGKHRSAYLAPGDAEVLRRWLDARPETDDDHVFLCASNRKAPRDWHAFTYWGLRQAIRRIAGRAGVHVSAHGFRHGFAISFLESGGDLSTLSDLLGHSDIQVTKDYYASFESDRLARAAERYSPGKALDRFSEEERIRQLWLPDPDDSFGTESPLVSEGTPDNGRDD